MTYDLRQTSRYSQQPVRLYLFYGADNFGPYAFTDSETTITRRVQLNGVTVPVPFQPWPISCNDISQSGTLDKTDTVISLALGSGLDDEYMAYPPSQVVNITVFEGTADEAPSPANFPAIWVGRVTGASPSGRELKVNAIPAIATMRRVALRRNYQLTCPHALYGPQCRASEEAATVQRSVVGTYNARITLQRKLDNPTNYRGGMVKWTNIQGRLEIRTILNVSQDGLTVLVRGQLSTLDDDSDILCVKGCNRIWDEDCTLVHNNVLNFGGQPFIPLENPISNKNQFF